MPEEVTACCRGLQLPLRFDNQAQEVTFMAVQHLCNLGSGYNTLLLERWAQLSGMLPQCILQLQCGISCATTVCLVTTITFTCMLCGSCFCTLGLLQQEPAGPARNPALWRARHAHGGQAAAGCCMDGTLQHGRVRTSPCCWQAVVLTTCFEHAHC